MMGGGDLISEPQPRANLWKDLAWLIEANDSRGASDFNVSSEPFARGVKVLMMVYDLLSVIDPPATVWVDMDAAQSHFLKIGRLLKIGYRNNHINLSKVRDAELKVRSEWAAIGHHSANLSLGGIITIVKESRSIFPIIADFLKVRNRPC